MAALHSALQALGPVDFVNVPTAPDELDSYVADLHAEAQLILESIPIAPPDEPYSRQRANTASSIASNASEMSSSSARSDPPPAEQAALQKEWGKPVKLSQKENPMGISVYKLGGKDGRGAWFARRSVHEGLGFARFKKGFEREFPTSLAVQGAPGEGNIRGIGAETRIEDIDVPHRGRVEVYRLSAQFPGPTTPRDFVTLLVTSSKAMTHEGQAAKVPELAPRHYMIISKPCSHPKTQPQSGFIRGSYESVEFIREIPKKLKASHSSTDLSNLNHKHGHSLEQDILIRNIEKKAHTTSDGNDTSHLQGNKSGSTSRGISPAGRKRSATVGLPESLTKHDGGEHYDPEENPVEWIMVTRSDPGGSVPRFMVERGTPSSICADAVKFLDWACQREEQDDVPGNAGAPPQPHRRDSFASWEANGHLAGINEQEDVSRQAALKPDLSETKSEASTMDTPVLTPVTENTPTSSSILSSVGDTLSAYTPQVVLNQLRSNTPKPSPGHPPARHLEPQSTDRGSFPQPDDDRASTISSTSFASADSHITSDDDDPSTSSQSPNISMTPSRQNTTQYEKELAKISQRKTALDAKFASTRAKLAASATKDSEKEQQALRKAEEKHEKEMKKQEERHAREMAKLEAKKKKEAQKVEERQRKQADKDEKSRLTRERDEARQELELLKKEQELWRKQIGELQRENTALAARLGDSKEGGRMRATTVSGLTDAGGDGKRSRSSSLLSRNKGGKEAAETSSQTS